MKCSYSFFSSHFCFLDACVVCIVSGGCNQTSSALLYVVFESLYRCIDTFLNAGQFPSSVCLRHLRYVRPYASSWVFCFAGPFFKVLLSSTLRIFQSIWRGWRLKNFPLMRFLLWGLISSCFLDLGRILILFFSFVSTCLIVPTSKYL